MVPVIDERVARIAMVNRKKPIWEIREMSLIYLGGS